MSNIATHFITQCRRSRIQDNFEVFNNFANLLTQRSDLKFDSYEHAKTFSCTFEMERLLNKYFGPAYDKMYDCLSECQIANPSGHIAVVKFDFKI
jgi:hypothetical protein